MALHSMSTLEQGECWNSRTTSRRATLVTTNTSNTEAGDQVLKVVPRGGVDVASDGDDIAVISEHSFVVIEGTLHGLLDEREERVLCGGSFLLLQVRCEERPDCGGALVQEVVVGNKRPITAVYRSGKGNVLEEEVYGRVGQRAHQSRYRALRAPAMRVGRRRKGGVAS